MVPTIRVSDDGNAISGAQPSRQGPHTHIEDDKGPGKHSSRRRGLDSSDYSYSDDDLDFDRRPARQRSRSYSIPNHRGRLDGPYYPTTPAHHRDSGYYGGTSMSAYPSYYPWDNQYGYPAYAGPGQMVPAPNTSILPPPRPSYARPPPDRRPYGDDQPAITAQEGTVVVRKTKLDMTETTRTSSLNDIDAVWNISSNRDVTLHLELDVEDDIDANVEEFACFTRRGDYKRAEEYYQDNLSRYSEQPKVIVEYVRMLVEKGAYKSIHDLGINETHLGEISRIGRIPHISEAIQLLLLLHIARIRTDADLNASSFAATIAAGHLDMLVEDDSERHQPFDHAQIQVLPPFVELFQMVTSQSQLGLHGILRYSPELALSQRLKTTYEKLLAEGSVWDIRDLMVSGVRLLGSKDTFSKVFPATLTEDAIHQFVAEWKTAETNEPSDLALLDILNSISEEKEKPRTIRLFANSEGDNNTWQTASNLARALASSIRSGTPELMKSRSYLEWLLHEERRNRTTAGDSRMNLLTERAVQSYPGKALDLAETFVYIPRHSENPGWPVLYQNRSEDEPTASQLIQVALKVARELGNFNLEVRCLHELACRAENPDSYFAELEHMFTSRSGDRLGLLKTRLMRYLTVANSDDTTRLKLKSQLVELDPRLPSVWRNFSDPVWEWAHRRVLFALMVSLGEGESEQAAVMDQQAQTLAVRLPGWVQMDDGANNPYQEALARERPHALYRQEQHQPRSYAPVSPPPPPPPPTEAPPAPAGSIYHFGSPVVDRGTPRLRSSVGEKLSRSYRSAAAGHERRDRIIERERSLERERVERRKSARFDEPEARISRSMERRRPESKDIGPKNASEMKKALQGVDERSKHNELIKKRAEEELQLEKERELAEMARKQGREEMQRMHEEQKRIALEIELEREKLRRNMEKEIREKLEMEAKARAEQRAMEEAMRARAAAEIKAQIRAEEEAKAAARAREEAIIQKAKEEAKRELELKRLAKKKAAAAKRLAKLSQEAREAVIYSEAEANVKRMVLAGLKAKVPGKRLRAMLGISDWEDSAVEGRMIEEVGHSDHSSSSVGPHTRRRRRFSSSSDDTESRGERRARRADSTERLRRHLHRRIHRDESDSSGTERDDTRRKPREDDDRSSDGISFDGPEITRRVSSSDEEENAAEGSSESVRGKGKEKEVVQEERIDTVSDGVEENEPVAQPEPKSAETQLPQSEPSSSPTSPQEPDPQPTAAKIKDLNKRAKVADESEEEAEEHGDLIRAVIEAGNDTGTATATEVQEPQQNSGDDELLSDGPAGAVDMDDDHDSIYE